MNINVTFIHFYLENLSIDLMSSRDRLFWDPAVDLATVNTAWFPMYMLLGQIHRAAGLSF